MDCIQPFRPSLMPLPPPPAKIIHELADPLLDRVRLGRPALGLAYYSGERLDRRWVEALDHHLQARGFYAEHLRLYELGDSPVQRLLSRQRVTDHLFTLEITPVDLPDAAQMLHTSVAQLNIQRDTLRDQRIGLILWIPLSHARRFADLASNLSDYRTVDVDLPALPDKAATSTVAEGAVTAVHNIPFDSIGSQFIGREAEIHELRQMLLQSGASAITDALAVEGLGGMGKTRLALEYAYRHLADYPFIFFLRADDPDTIRSQFGRLADLSLPGLSLPPEAQEEVRFEAAVEWLVAHPGWLLILDNADAESSASYLAEHLLPRLRGCGHILLTTRYARWGGQVRPLKLDALGAAAGVDFLLDATRQHRRVETSDAEDARQLVAEVEGLPLALEQIAAWINQQHASFREARASLHQDDASLLSWYDPVSMRYPLPVAAVWEQTVQSLNEPQRFLVRVLAWLAAQPVPDFLHAEAAKLDALREQDVSALVRGLESRNILKARDDRSTQLHRLHHELERRRTPAEERQAWKDHLLVMLAAALPLESGDVRTWPRMRLLEPHLQAVVENLADRQSAQLQALSLVLNQWALFVHAQARYAQAEPLMRRALGIDEASYGPDHPEVAIRLNNLAALLQDTNRLAEAEPLMRRALGIDEASYGQEHPMVAIHLNNLAMLLQATNRQAEAEPLMRRALGIDEASYGRDHPNVARGLNNLAQLLQDTNRLAEAEPLYRRALGIDEASYGPDHPRVSIDLNNLAQLLQATNRLTEAEPLLLRALSIEEASYGQDHPNVAIRLNNLALLLQATKRLAEAKPLMRRASRILVRGYGLEHPRTRTALENYRLLLADPKLTSEEVEKRVQEVLAEAEKK